MKQERLVTTEIKSEYLRKHRRTKRESQGHFWSRFGVTQSRGSRFEKGAEIPKPVAILLELYFNGVVTDGDLKISQMPINGNSAKRDSRRNLRNSGATESRL